ncbi:MAG: hypothetical protein P1P87_03155, partial [Trueperaceae bacterium]|nr:hypothetical protein [Trueperaceae bacterium]
MPPATVRLFGRPELIDRGRTYLGANQLHRFLAYLATRGEWVPRDAAVFLFWPDRVDAVGRRNLRKLLHRARRLVDGVEVEDDRIRWPVASDLEAWRALADGDPADALALAHGPLLEGLDVGAPSEFVAWLDQEREHLRTQLVDGVVARCAELARTDAE